LPPLLLLLLLLVVVVVVLCLLGLWEPCLPQQQQRVPTQRQSVIWITSVMSTQWQMIWILT
jgi:hypothetical protein